MFGSFFFDGWDNTIRIVFMSVIVYIYLMVIMRLAGKRALSQFNMFEMIITIAYGSTIASILLTKTISFLEGAIALGMLTLIQFTLGFLQQKSEKFSSLVNPTPRCLYENDEYNEEALRREKVMKSEIRNVVRQQGIGSMNDVAVVVLEENGQMSVIPKSDASSLDVLEDVERYH